MTSTEIHEELGGNINTLRNTLKQMVTAGQLRVSAEGPPSERGYSLPGAQTERKF
jgi:DNA-binding transcriptional regulator PaaX